jgi:hypothetical protein
LNGAAVIASVILGNPGPTWRVVRVGDNIGDGQYDIRFQNNKGEVLIWKVKGFAVLDKTNPAPSWHAIGSGNSKPSR